MRNFLEQARSKSIKERKTIAVVVSGLIVAAIFAVWATTLVGRLTTEPELIVVDETIEDQ